MNNYESMETGKRETPAVLISSVGQVLTERQHELDSVVFKQNWNKNESISTINDRNTTVRREIGDVADDLNQTQRLF